MDVTGICGADGRVGRGVGDRECRCATTVERNGRDPAGVWVRGVGVRDVREEGIGCGRGVSGTAVCVELDEVELEEGHGEGERSTGGFGVGVRLDEGEGNSACC